MSIRFPIRSLIAGCLAMALPAAAADHISIAATLPLTGTESRSGLQYREGYDLAFALANAKGGLRVGGKQYLVDLRAVDDASDPAKAGSLLEAYVVRDHVNLLLSSYSTRLVESQSTVAEKHHVPLVIGGASSKSLLRRCDSSRSSRRPASCLPRCASRFSGRTPPTAATTATASWNTCARRPPGRRLTKSLSTRDSRSTRRATASFSTT
ncbi:MAG: hypothetical protein E6J85_18190 [Deltaproteobacteria bacterium]|nr:MAG: hypothetical protein E6J85_18190 [Deltaproteobacteria bacterium]